MIGPEESSGAGGMSDMQAMIAKRIASMVDANIGAFIRKLEGGVLPDFETVSQFGHRCVLHNVQDPAKDWAEFFVWRKNNVIAWRYGVPGQPYPVVFCHLFPDDWPEPLAQFIASIP